MRCPKRVEKRGETPNEAARVSQHMQGRAAGSRTTTPRLDEMDKISTLVDTYESSHLGMEKCTHIRINLFVKQVFVAEKGRSHTRGLKGTSLVFNTHRLKTSINSLGHFHRKQAKIVISQL